MALVKYGGGIIGMSGSIAGNTFARNRSGNYVRSRTKPVNPRSALQSLVRAAISLMTVRWAVTLSGAQRIAWNLFAANVGMKNKLGETINLSGFNHYIRSNSLLSRSGLTIVDDAPITFELPAADPTFAITASQAAQTLIVTYDAALAWLNEDGGFLYIFQGAPQNTQRIFFGGPWRFIGHVSGVDPAGPAGPAEIAAAFPIGEGQKMWAYARIQRADGRVSEVFRVETWITA